MNIIGQPASYSEMLERIFITSVATGIACTYVLAQASPEFKNIMNSLDNLATISFLHDIKVLYILIPIVIAVFSRMARLHDKISDVLRIRQYFDVRFLLIPLTKGSVVAINNRLEKRIKSDRRKVMSAIFYPYASFITPVIDSQLVRTAADNWGWFWVLIESSFLIFITTVVLIILKQWCLMKYCLIAIGVELVFMKFLWIACKNSARRQVEAILNDQNRRESIQQYFNTQ